MEEPQPRAVAPSDLVDHLFSLAKLLQGAQSEDVVHFNTAETKQRCSEFINDPAATTLFASKLSEGAGWLVASQLDEKESTDASPVSTIVVIKDKGIIRYQDGTWEKNLQVVNLPHSGSSFDTLRSLISFGVGTYFDAITSQNRTEVVASTKKKINELALSLQNLEQMIQVPDLIGSLHPVIQDAVSKGATLENYLEHIPESTLTDSTFLNSVQTIVNEWVRVIQTVTRMERDVSDGSALDEVNFWISMEASLTAIQEQLDSPGVQLSLEVLKYAKRYHATVSFMSDIAIKDAMARTVDYNKLMRDIPLNDLIAAESFSKIEEAIVLIMNHMKKLRVTSYPVNRALPFVEAISADLEAKLKPMLQDTMALEFDDFKTQIDQCNVVFDTWDRQIKEFTNLSRELLRKRGEKFIFVKVNSKTTYIKERLDNALEFRTRHEDFVSTIKNIEMSQDDLEHAYDAIRVIDLLDHEKLWTAAKRSYDKRIQQIENHVVEELRQKLDSTTNFNEMFQVFEQHNTLLERPRIRGAVQEYQSQLLSVVKDEIAHLQHNFVNKHEFDSVAPLRDYPAVAFSLIWARQTEEKLMHFLERIELILGKEWSSYAEGQKIYAESMVFKKKLNSQGLYEEWLANAADKTVSGKVLEVVKENNTASLRVNFDESLLSFFKEVRALCWQKFPVPHAIMVSSRQARKVYPHAIILRESLNTLTTVLSGIESLGDVAVLVHGEREEIYRLITVCLEVDWESLSRSQDLEVADVQINDYNQLSLIVSLENSIEDLFHKSQTLLQYHSDISKCLESLQNCDFDLSSFASNINKLQAIIDTISSDGFTNVSALVDCLNKTLINTLIDRYTSTSVDGISFDHVLQVGSSITVQPLLEQTKVDLYHTAQSHVKIILQQKRLIEKTLHTKTDSFELDFSEHMNIIIEHMNKVMVSIEDDFRAATEFVSTWYQFQALWDVNSGFIYSDLDLKGWFELFEDIKKSRALFDSADVTRVCGCFVISFGEAITQISSKFMMWNREVLIKFAETIGDLTKDTHENITKARKSLESSDLNLASVQDTVEVITNVQKQKKYAEELRILIEQLRTSEKLLSKQRFELGEDYIYVGQIENDFDALIEVIARRSKSIEDHSDVIRKNIETECTRMENAIVEAQENWTNSRPVGDLTTPSKAISILSAIEKTLTSLDIRKKLLVEAALLLALPVSVTGDLTSTIQELTDLKSVWVSIQGLWGSLEDLRNLKWSLVKPRALRKQLEDLVAATRAMPVRVRQYQPFQYFLKTVTDLSNSQKVLVSLKEDFVKERHLKTLFKNLGKSWPSDLTVGNVWDLDLLMNQGAVKSIIDQANSERAIEEALQGIKDTWDDQGFVFFDFKSHSLVKNFPRLLECASNDIASLNSMRNSPVFKVFEKEILQWESAVSKLYQIVDVWVEVQRKWIDLEGVFDAKSGVRKLLPQEYSRFHSVSTEYQNTLKKIYRNSIVIEITGIPDLSATMERLSESLNRIAKALGEFLEKQRELCARLYFVGNDDLIDMIANKDNVGKHFKKMFAGVNSVGYDESGDSIVSVSSVDGEAMTLSHPVSLQKYQRLDEWLNQLDYEIKVTISELLKDAVLTFRTLPLDQWAFKYPTQVLLLSLQIIWSTSTENSIVNHDFVSQLLEIETYLSTLGSLSLLSQKTREALIIELVHHKDVLVSLKDPVKSCLDFAWLKHQRFYINAESDDPLQSVLVKQSTKTFIYGFEYLGTMDRLVYTPLLNSCFIAMTGALDQGLGGSPFGPAGTGKTETVKALGQNLGKMVLVFNCDESFDFQAITRLLVGICQIGGWGCFDEFNRLNKNILSAVSSQLELIELSLKSKSGEVKLLEKATPMGDGTGVFVTMNPEYAGRSALPDNLKKLFRSFSMQKPDTEVISEVLLRARGFDEASTTATTVVQFFQSLTESCSKQQHYDFGLRALKSTLEHAAKILTKYKDAKSSQIIAKALNEMVLPRLVTIDIEVYHQLMDKYFNSVQTLEDAGDLRSALIHAASSSGYVASDPWLNKCEQLFKIQETKQGVMLVGKSGSGKTVIWKMLLHALCTLTGTDYVYFTIDPKVKTKNELFGFLDPITREWVDGIFTGLIRRLNSREESPKVTWIVFDGDVDPVWVESLNSVLDDNKVLTLPNGERLKIPESVRFVFEVDSLQHATPATVSRCGMVWVEDGVVSLADIFKFELYCFEHMSWTEETNEVAVTSEQQEFATNVVHEAITPEILQTLVSFAFSNLHPVMPLSEVSLVRNFLMLLKSKLTVSSLLRTKESVLRSIMLCLTWSFSGSCALAEKELFSEKLSDVSSFHGMLPEDDGINILDLEVGNDGEWVHLSDMVPSISLESHAIANPNTVVPTVDTLRHEQLVYSVLQQRKSLLLCGPPGSGKTMTLYAALERAPEIELSNMNFSKETEPSSVLKALEQLCEYKRTSDGFVLCPKSAGKRVVLFADEINLPREDDYGTQRVISFLRQLIEKNGFWRSSDRQWVHIQDIQLVGACNPPSDIGRVKLSDRFLSHLLVVMVDYPGQVSLEQVYYAFNSSVLKIVPQLSGYTKEVTTVMLQVYNKIVSHFTSDQQAHYVYSPRELTRWVRGIYTALRPGSMVVSELIRLLAHEGVRLFSDRLALDEDREWTWSLIYKTIENHFPTTDLSSSLARPLLYSNWLALNYEPVSNKEISSFIRERLRVFADEVLDVELTLYDEAIDHILRIDRVLKQPQGHMILIGPSSSGKTTLAKFVSWVNGLKIHQLGVNRKYTLAEFDLTLKDLLKRSGIDDEKICFIVDESTILDGAFLERMNSLLANSQIQEIFDQDEFAMLMSACKDQVNARGLLLDTQDELYGWFTQQVAANLHIVFTISDPTSANAPQIIASPALFNRCVINWMGDWSSHSLVEVSKEMLLTVPLDRQDYVKPENYVTTLGLHVEMYRDAVVDVLIHIHRLFSDFSSPGKLVDFIKNFIHVYDLKDSELKEHQKHVDSGLVRLKETVLKVKRLKDELSQKEQILKVKEVEARQTLNKILTEQNEAERKQEASIQIQAALERQDVMLEERRAVVMGDLALAEPAVLEARRGVQNIKKQHLTELRSMSTPPATVQLTLESVCVLLGYDVGSWRDVQQIIRKDDFIANIVNFDCETQVTPEVRDFMEDTYLSRPDYNFQSADRASKACGPLLQWVEAQVKYSIVLDKIGPLKEEVEMLEEESARTQARLLAADDMITELQESIESYKDEYSELIREIENIKSEMSTVDSKAGRAMTLVESLTQERTRWTKSIQKFDEQYRSLSGNSMLAAAMLTYTGGFDNKKRQSFMKACINYMINANIMLDQQFRFAAFLNSSSNLLSWEGHGLANDELFFENVTIIENAKRIPLIIDPFGSILETISSKIAPQKMTITSFLDDGFVRTLENSLRFGGLLVIQDAEYFDPILSPILNGDFQRVGGRTLVKIGGRDIDCSKNFKLYLHTRDSSIRPSPFVLTRTTIVDFTITNSSLEVQSLNLALSSERPDLEKKRLELIKLDTEYKVKLRTLEDSLLTALSESRGDLLENNELLASLEGLKKESMLVEEKIRETANVMSKIEDVIVQYEPFAKNSALVFSVMDGLSSLSEFYQFSLSSYLEYIQFVLAVQAKTSQTQSERVEELVLSLYQEVFARVSISLKSRDKMVFALALSLVYLSERDGDLFVKFVLTLLEDDEDKERSLIVRDALSVLSIQIPSTGLDKLLSGDISELKSLDVNLDDLDSFLKSYFSSGSVGDCLSVLSSFLSTGSGPFSSKYDLDSIIGKQDHRPIVLGSVSGCDASFRVRSAADVSGNDLRVIALGSIEATDIASRELEKRSKSGGWLLVQNVQTASVWLEYLEKKLQGLPTHDGFKLFLTCDVGSALPTTLLRYSHLLVFENSPGMKTIMKEYFKTLGEKLNATKPVEKSPIYFMMCWFHAIVQERSRFVPMGFTKNYDFNDSDFEGAVFLIDRWFEEVSSGRSNVSPETIDWAAIQFFVGDIVYGGKANVVADVEYLRCLAKQLFCVEIYSNTFNMIENDVALAEGQELNPPEGTEVGVFEAWIQSLPDLQPPSWIGFEKQVEMKLMRQENKDVVKSATKLYEEIVSP